VETRVSRAESRVRKSELTSARHGLPEETQLPEARAFFVRQWRSDDRALRAVRTLLRPMHRNGAGDTNSSQSSFSVSPNVVTVFYHEVNRERRAIDAEMIPMIGKGARDCCRIRALLQPNCSKVSSTLNEPPAKLLGSRMSFVLERHTRDPYSLRFRLSAS
jgi:hypothetical protein